MLLHSPEFSPDRTKRPETSRARTRLLLLGLFVLPLAVACASGPRAATPRPGRAEAGPVMPRDVLALPLLAELEVAPGATTAVYTLHVPDAGEDAFTSEIWRIDLDLGTSERVSSPGRNARSPRFSADGLELAWLVDGDESTELVVARQPRGRARTVASFAQGIDEFDWSPDGRRFVVVRRDSRPAGWREDAPKLVTRTLAQADGVGLLDTRRRHLWTVEREGGAIAQITVGPYDDESPRWSPDGRWIAFVSNRAPDPDATDDSDIFVVGADGTRLRRLPSGPGPDTQPAWSTAGDRIAYLAMARANDYYQPHHLSVLPLDGSGPTDLSGALDAWVASDALAAGADAARPIWLAEDREILIPFERRGATWIAAVPTEPGREVRELAGGRAVHGLVRPLPGGDWLATVTTPTHPPELYRFSASTNTPPRRLTHLYDDWLEGRRLVEPERLTATNSAGDSVESWLYPPLEREAGRRYPLVVYIHGGPQVFDGDFFDFDLENQLFPARGWGVLRVNYRGSTSYGEAFSRALWGDWHRREHEDLMAALDGAIAGHPWIDPDRLGIGGWSYGGIMTLWTVGHTDRFKVGVPERFGFDYLSSFGEDQWFVWYLTELGSPLENAELYRRLSPGTYLDNVTTPLYLIANEEDRNCPLPQVLQAYQRLKLLGQETELVVYPGEPHSMQQPSHLIDRLERLLDWYGRHLDE